MKKTNPIRDEIVDQIHETRRRNAEKFGFDLAAIAEDARKRQAASGRPTRPAPRRAKSS
jgi:hypothetical protein